MRIAGPPAHVTRTPADNMRLEAIYTADQGDRSGPTNTIDLKRMAARDIPRRAEVGGLVARGALHTANDFYRAAMVFQHGTTVDHIRTAYRLASKGAALDATHKEARWLCAASFDRICLYENKPQRYGTQFTRDKATGQWILYSVDPTTTDAERAKWGVPSLAAQLEKGARMNRGEI